jgi:hypothetical protein
VYIVFKALLWPTTEVINESDIKSANILFHYIFYILLYCIIYISTVVYILYILYIYKQNINTINNSFIYQLC